MSPDERLEKADWFLRILAGIFVLAVGFAVAVAVSLWPRTDYAAGYSERAFDEMKIGADAAEALGALGEPFEVREDRVDAESQQTLFYTRPAPGYENYRVRAVVLDSKGQVIRKIAETHID